MPAVYLPITRLCLLVVAAVGMQLMQPQLWPQWAYMALCGAGATGVLGAWGTLGAARAAKARLAQGALHRRMATGVLLASAALLAFGSTGWRASRYAASILPAHWQQRDIVVQGHIAGLPQWLPDGARFTFAVEQATLDGQAIALPQHISLAWYVPRPDTAYTPQAAANSSPSSPAAARPKAADSRCTVCVAPGERWQFTVRLKQPHGSRNPFGFDYERWLWEQGLGATGYVRAAAPHPAPEKIGQPHPLDVRAWRDRARLHAREAVYRTLLPAASPPTPAAPQDAATPGAAPTTPLAESAAGIVAALLMGDQRAISQPDWAVFRTTGVSHLLSISGLHITLFAWLAGIFIQTVWRQSARMGWVAPCLWLPATAAAWWGGVALAAAYAWFSGWGVPAQRTCLMLLCMALLRSRGLAWPWWCTLATAAAAVVLVDPWALLQAGFWLSFVAVAVLFGSSQRPRPAGTLWHQQLRAGMRTFAHAQLAITLVLAPLTLLLFGQVSVVGLVANALAVPLMTFIITPLALAGVAWPALWQLAAWLLQGLVLCLHYLAALPGASYHAAIAPWWAGVLGVAGGLMAMQRLPVPWRLAAALGLLPVLLWQAPRPAQGQFELLAADVGQGSAILVRTRTHSLLFDSGPQYSTTSNAGERVLVPLLDALGEQPEWLLLSHQDTDHIGGATALLAARPHMQLLGSISAEHPLQQLRPVMPCTTGQTWQWDGVTFSILHPTEHEQTQPTLPDNAMSCVLHISNGQRSALLAGDVGTAQERAIIARQQAEPASLRADILLVGHHGSKTSTSAAWLDAVQPRWAVIQQGYLNHYRHPHPGVLQRLQERHITTTLSESCGAAWWHSSNNQLHCERAQSRRYWQHRPAPVTAQTVIDQAATHQK